MSKWHNTHREHLRAYMKEYRLKNAEALKEKQRIYDRKVKEEVITAYGGTCACCGEHRHEFLSIDHIDGTGNKHREELGWEGGRAFYVWLKKRDFPKDNYQLLCMNCNFAKGIMGYCPHEKEKVN